MTSRKKSCEKHAYIELPDDPFYFWLAVKKFAEAMAKLVLEDPTSDAIMRRMEIIYESRKIHVWGGVEVCRIGSEYYYILPSKGWKTVVCVYNPEALAEDIFECRVLFTDEVEELKKV